jgi:hypothetical protein
MQDILSFIKPRLCVQVLGKGTLKEKAAGDASLLPTGSRLFQAAVDQ